MRLPSFAIAIAFAVATIGGSAYSHHRAQVRDSTRIEAPAVVEEFAGALEELFVFPEVGRRYATALRSNAAAGRYSSVSSPSALADAINADLQAIYPDGHLSLRPPRAAGDSRSIFTSPESGVERTGWLAEGIAYIGFTNFPGNEATLDDVREFLADHASARTLIIDLCGHGGGLLDEIDVMFSHFYERPTVLVHMDTRQAAFRETSPSPYLERVDGPHAVVRQAHVAVPAEPKSALRDAEIILLTSGYTGSAAEHFALALKRTHRATLIGETTAGAGHYGRIIDLPAGYSAFVPVGRTFDPDTDEGWEGTGVQPHIQVPAERALYEALVRSGVVASRAEKLGREFRPSGSMKRILPLRPRLPDI